MGTIADKLNYLNTTKTNIKNAIIEKGVTVETTDTFRDYATRISEITDGSVEELTVTENGTYTGTGGVTYNPVTVDIDDTDLYRDTTDSTYESVKTLSNCGAFPMLSLKVGIEPQQDLHGYDSPWVGGSGKNKCPINESTITDTSFIIDTDINIASGTWTFSFESAVTTNCSLQITDADENILASIAINNPSRSKIITINAVGKHLKFYGYAGTYKKIQIESGSTVTAFEPYSNICPISGWDEGNVVASPTTDAEDGTTYTIQFTDGDNPLTVYGGTLDVVSGELKVTDGYIASYNGETLPSTWISDRDVYAEGTTPTTGAEVCYKLATPQTYQLTPTQVNSLLGTNNIWADTGDVGDVRYFEKVEL